jgi:hypothetical protein
MPKFTLMDGSQGDSGLPASVGPTLQILLVAALLVMVVACANVAGLMLARAGDRERELAVRSALGGGRWRLARMLLAEALVLGLAGTVAGIFVARLIGPIGVSLLRQFGQPVTLDLELNVRVLGLAVGAGLVTALLAGLAPVLRGWRMARLSGLIESSRTATASRAARYWQRGLVVAQFALTFALVAAAGLLVRTLVNLRSIPTGLDTEHVLLVGANIQAARFDGPQARDYVRQSIERLSGIGGVRAAGFAQILPLGFGGSRTTIFAPGYTPKPNEDMEINFNIVSSGYFDAIGITLKDGRTFRNGLTPTVSPIEVVVNETLAAPVLARPARDRPDDPFWRRRVRTIDGSGRRSGRREVSGASRRSRAQFLLLHGAVESRARGNFSHPGSRGSTYGGRKRPSDHCWRRSTRSHLVCPRSR